MNSSDTSRSMPALPVASAYPAASLRAGMTLWYYFCTSVPIMKFLFFAGVFFLPVSLLGGLLFSPNFGFGVAIYIFIAAIVLPLLVAVPLQRQLLGSRRLCQLPGFPLTSGLVLLAMCIVGAGFLPFIAWLYGMPIARSVVMLPRVFIMASLYTAVLQYCLVSRHAMPLLSILPFLFIMIMHQFEEAMGSLLGNTLLIQSLALLCLAGWGHALLQLHRRSAFKPPHALAGNMMLGYDYGQTRNPFALQFEDSSAPPAASLLLGFAASLRGRCLNLGQMVLLSPLVCSVLMAFIWHDDVKRPSWTSLLFIFHMFIIATIPWSWGELAARSRLLWLRVGGNRQAIWFILEKQLWISYAVMFGFTLLLLPLAWSAHSPAAFHWAVLALVLVTSVHNGWLNLLARLHHWAPWLQLIVMLLTLLLLIIAFAVAKVTDDNSPMWGLAAGMVVLVLYYRGKCRTLFARVDWLMLRPLTFNRQATGRR